MVPNCAAAGEALGAAHEVGCVVWALAVGLGARLGDAKLGMLLEPHPARTAVNTPPAKKAPGLTIRISSGIALRVVPLERPEHPVGYRWR
jgi:hypothetical protein